MIFWFNLTPLHAIYSGVACCPVLLEEQNTMSCWRRGWFTHYSEALPPLALCARPWSITLWIFLFFSDWMPGKCFATFHNSNTSRTTEWCWVMGKTIHRWRGMHQCSTLQKKTDDMRAIYHLQISSLHCQSDLLEWMNPHATGSFIPCIRPLTVTILWNICFLHGANRVFVNLVR